VLGPRPALELRPPEKLFMDEYRVRTAVGVEILERVLASPVDLQVPLAAEIMMDALEARTQRDYKKAILYAAIATESALSARLDEEYEKILQAGLDCARFRVVERTLAGSCVKREDPVYAAIPETFKTLLHERSLYVLGRSILLEDEDIYRQAVKLYKTRNLLAHGGAEAADQDVYSLDKRGAVGALAVAIRILEWTGDSGPYVLSDDMVNPIDPSRKLDQG
jgi:hypothetical protein